VLKSWLSCHVLCLLASEVFRSGIRFFSLPRTTLLILSIIVEEANILPGLQLLLLPFFIMMFAATAEQAWTVNLLSAALYQSGLFLAVFKLLVIPFGLTH